MAKIIVRVAQKDCWKEPLFAADQLNVFLTISPLATTLSNDVVEQRQIELNWSNGRPFPGDWVALYEHDPTNNPTQPLLQVPVLRSSGYFKTDVQFGFPLDRRMKITDACLGYWIGYNRNGATIASNCLKVRPNWMWQNRRVLGSVPLHQLFLPGTHNSGSYRAYQGHASDTVFMRYLICQDEDLWHQLIYGIRYLDIRVGYYPDQEERFWLNHNYARVNPLSALISDLKIFLQATRELVVLDFHRFPVGFSQKTDERHLELVELLERQLGDFMVPNSFRIDATMDQLWAMNKTLIVTYADDWTRATHPLLWPTVPQEWGDKRSVDDLFFYLLDVDRKRSNYHYFWAAMAELTPSTFDVLFRPNEGLRKLSELSNRNVTTWYRDRWWSTANIVAVDFFHSTDIIDVALQSNIKRAACIQSNQTSPHQIALSTTPSPVNLFLEERTLFEPNYHGPRSLNIPASSTVRSTKHRSNSSSRNSGRRRRTKVSRMSTTIQYSQPSTEGSA